MKRFVQTGHFKKDIKKLTRRGKNVEKLKAIVRMISEDQILAPRHRDHSLTGNWAGSRDCHIEPDWILIYRVDDDSLFLERTGSHSDLFG